MPTLAHRIMHQPDERSIAVLLVAFAATLLVMCFADAHPGHPPPQADDRPTIHRVHARS